MKGAIIDFRTDDAIIKRLTDLGINPILSTDNLCVHPALSGHPDMQICKCAEDVFVCCPLCYDHYKNALSEYGVKIFKGRTPLGRNYPEDIAYNVAWIGKKAIHNLQFTDSVILDYFEKSGVEMINVSQGYSKCNICQVSSNGVITSDEGIYKALAGTDIDVLIIGGGYVDICGWDYGFIGGASGKIDNETLAFCGDISEHPDYAKISEFCLKHNVKCLSLSSKRLIDTGSIILVESAVV